MYSRRISCQHQIVRLLRTLFSRIDKIKFLIYQEELQRKRAILIAISSMSMIKEDTVHLP